MTPAADPSGLTATGPVAFTAVIRPAGRDAAGPPPSVTLCGLCDAVADGAAPPGWVVGGFSGRPADADDVWAGFRICPGCVSGHGIVLPPGLRHTPPGRDPGGP